MAQGRLGLNNDVTKLAKKFFGKMKNKKALKKVLQDSNLRPLPCLLPRERPKLL